MFGNFFSNMYYGKGNRPDFTKDQLPANRWQLFWDMLRVRFTGLMQVNFQTVLFAIPAIFWTYLQFAVMMSLTSGGTETAQMEAMAAQLPSLMTTYLLLMIPCLMVLGLGVVGMVNVLQQWARDGHASAGSDFFAGIKENWKQALIVSLINGVFLLVFYIAVMTYGQMAAQNGGLFIFMQSLMWVIGGVFAVANIYLFPLMVSYKLRVADLYKNAFLMAIARLPWSLLFALLWALPLVIVLTLIMLVGGGQAFAIMMLVMLAYGVLLGFALPQFVLCSYTNATFEKLLNPHIPGAPVNRGLRLEEDEEDEPDSSDIGKP